MTSVNESIYYSYLEKIIKDRKDKGIFFPLNTRDYEMDISLLVDYIQQKNPNLTKKILDNYIDIDNIPPLKNASDNVIKNFVKNLPKGTIAHLTNDKGENIYLLNNGAFQKLHVIKSTLNKNDLDKLKKTILKNVLKDDIKLIYGRLHKNESKTTKIIYRPKTDVSIKEINPIASNKFEKDFIEISQKWGTTASPMALFGAYITSMNEKEKTDLFGMFTQKGINTTDKLCKHLNELVDKAHSKKQIVEHKFQREKHKSLSLRGR